MRFHMLAFYYITHAKESVETLSYYIIPTIKRKQI